jgi:hypothetical protein
MATITAPYVETQQVVTGYMYQLYVGEEQNGQGITGLDIGPYYFEGAPPRIKYPEAVTNELCPPDWQAIRWFTDEAGASWLRWQGGRIDPEDGEIIFQYTSNYPPSENAAALYIRRGLSQTTQRYAITAPDYTQSPPRINSRHDVIGQKRFASTGCAPTMALALSGIVLLIRHWLA